MSYFRAKFNSNVPDPDTLIIEATYAVDGISSGSNSCLLITQRYEFGNADKGCEPSAKLPCARFFPMVQYKFYGAGDEKLEYINMAQRSHFRPDRSFKNVGGIFRDCDGDLCVVTDVISNNSVFSRRENPVVAEKSSPEIVINHGVDTNTWDNIHLSYRPHVHEPRAVMPAAGCPECVHVHWRWGVSSDNSVLGLGGPQFFGGRPIIPRNSTQTVEFGLTKNNNRSVDFHPNNKFTELLNAEQLASTDLIFWYSGTGYREKETFFVHGGFFGPDKSLNPPVNKNNVRIAFAHLYEDGETQVAQVSAAGLGALPSGYTAYNDLAYDISTEAIVSGPHTITFNVSSITDPAIFNRLRVLHAEHEGHWVDATTLSPDSPVPDFANKAISARVDSFSPFVIALVGETVDTTPPMITAPANIIANNTAGQCSAQVNPGTATGTDNLPGVVVSGIRNDGIALTEAYPLGVTTITWTATDAAGNTTSALQTVTVTNPAPVVTLTGPATGAVSAVGTLINFTGTFTDNPGTHTATWSFDGLTAAGTVNEATGAVTGSFTLTAAGVYKVSLTVADGCGGTGTANTINGLDLLVVVYDPSGGWVTGGGWINSPAGAYALNPTLAGKANFGFVSKYHNGATIPTGNTEFQFKAGNLNFSSTAYEWLVIGGARAQYKGSGTINGGGDYRFMLTAIDGQEPGGGGQDMFRIRIWNNAGGGLVYDNQMNASDNAEPTTMLGGGQIVIHR